MIVPIIGEDQWQSELTTLPMFDPGDAPIVLISPHPDDETLAAGALVATHCDRGRDVLVIAVTDGENAYDQYEGLREIRSSEQERAIEILGNGRAELVRLGLNDSGVSADIDRLVGLLREYVRRDTHVVAPWTGDYHPDHEACGRAAYQAAREVDARLTWYFFWTWHRGTPADLEGLDLRSFRVDLRYALRKRDALNCHRSQLEHASGEPILSRNLLEPAFRNFEVFAPAC